MTFDLNLIQVKKFFVCFDNMNKLITKYFLLLFQSDEDFS